MSLLLDKQYVNLISAQLVGFKWARSMLATCRCPICGDSKKRSRAKRFYIYRNSKNGMKDYLSVHCHNCGYGNPFGKFLQEFNTGVYSQYRLDHFREMGWKAKEAPQEAPEPVPEPEPFTDTIEGCVALLDLPEDHFCVRYVLGRKIPRSEWSRLWFTENFKAAVETFADPIDGEDEDDDPTKNLPEDARLVIPFKDEFGSVTCVQGRALNDSKMRYITIKQNEMSSKLFGRDRVDKSKTVYVLEGPIDSLFIPNSIATADAHLCDCEFGHVMVHDNQPRNRQVCNEISNSIDAGKKVVLFPSWLEYKDVNDMVKLGGFTQDELMKLIDENTFHGLRAKLKFSEWKKY